MSSTNSKSVTITSETIGSEKQVSRKKELNFDQERWAFVLVKWCLDYYISLLDKHYVNKVSLNQD